MDLRYWTESPWGQHQWRLAARMGRPGEPRRDVVVLEDRWSLVRGVTLVSAVAWSADADARNGRPLPELGLAWDVTGDGRTVLRSSVAPDQRSIGVERELLPSMAGSVDLVERRLLLGLHKREGQVRLDLSFSRQGPGDHLVRAALGFPLTAQLALGALASRDQGWQLGLRAIAQLTDWLDFPLSLATDGLLIEGAGSLRLSLRSSY